MKQQLLSILVDPVTKAPLVMDADSQSDSEIVSGRLLAKNGTIYPVSDGIPRFAHIDDEGQRETSNAFEYLWKDRDTFSSEIAQKTYSTWLVENFGFSSEKDRATYFAEKTRILDLGCGRGYASSSWLRDTAWNGRAMWVGMDITQAVDVAKGNLEHLPNTHFVQGDALAIPFRDGSFDAIISQGVLHHTPSTRLAILSGSRVLSSGGEFHFYVYRKKGPIREFADDYIREQIAALSDEAAWDVMRSLTHLGKSLWEAKADILVEEDIPLLGIQAGSQNVQRLIYWNFAKLYWNEALTFEENTHVNFDWYRPRYAHRQTAEEVRQWCEEADLSVQWFHEQESGFSVRAIKR